MSLAEWHYQVGSVKETKEEKPSTDATTAV